MKKTVSYSKSQLLDDLGRLALMVLASVIMAVNLKSFVQAGDLVPGGFNGLTLLIQRVALRFWGLSVPFSAINFLLNSDHLYVGFFFFRHCRNKEWKLFAGIDLHYFLIYRALNVIPPFSKEIQMSNIRVGKCFCDALASL